MIDPRFKDLLQLSLTERLQLVEDLRESIALDAATVRSQVQQSELDLGLTGPHEQLQVFPESAWLEASAKR